MTNEEAIYIINNRLNTYYCTDEDLEALDLAVKALANAGPVKIEVTEHHTFAKPDDVSDLDFPGVSSEDK